MEPKRCQRVSKGTNRNENGAERGADVSKGCQQGPKWSQQSAKRELKEDLNAFQTRDREKYSTMMQEWNKSGTKMVPKSC